HRHDDLGGPGHPPSPEAGRGCRTSGRGLQHLGHLFLEHGNPLRIKWSAEWVLGNLFTLRCLFAVAVTEKVRPVRNSLMNEVPPMVESPSTDDVAALRAIVEGTARHTGQEFFQSLVRYLAAAVGTRYAFVAEFAGEMRARTLAFWFRDRFAENVEWNVI